MDQLARLNGTLMPFAQLLGIRYLSAEPDRVIAELTVTEALCTVPAVAHGGVLMAFADTLGAAGTLINLPDGTGTTTLESKTNFVSAAPVGTVLTGEATPVHRGRTTMVWQTRVTTQTGRLAALVTQTQLVLPAKT